MSDIKKLLNGPQAFVYRTARLGEESSKYLKELLKVLSDNSREIKSELQQIKKEACDVEDWKEVCFDYDMRILKLIEKSPEGVLSMKIIEYIDALASMWNWKYEDVSNYITGVDADEDLQKVTKRFASYSDSFRSLYIRTATEYLRKYKRIPDYKVILKIAFCKHVKRYMESYLRNMKFDEEDSKENFSEIQEWLKEKDIDFEASDNIQESFIKLCREKYPLAKKNSDFIFNLKNFKREFLDLFIKNLDSDLASEFDKTFEYCRKDIEGKGEEYELMEFINLPIYIIDAMNEITGRRVREEWVIALYFTEILGVFEEEHNKKLKLIKHYQGI